MCSEPPWALCCSHLALEDDDNNDDDVFIAIWAQACHPSVAWVAQQARGASKLADGGLGTARGSEPRPANRDRPGKSGSCISWFWNPSSAHGLRRSSAGGGHAAESAFRHSTRRMWCCAGCSKTMTRTSCSTADGARWTLTAAHPHPGGPHTLDEEEPHPLFSGDNLQPIPRAV